MKPDHECLVRTGTTAPLAQMIATAPARLDCYQLGGPTSTMRACVRIEELAETPMKHVTWESLPEAVREAIQTLTAEPTGTVIERDGRPTYRLLAYPQPAAAVDDDWTDAKNDRRCDLIDKDIAGDLTPDERVELEDLQLELRRHVNRVAPLPLDALRKLQADLLDKAARAAVRPG